MRGLIVGFGNIAQGHLQGYSTITDLEPVAVVDVTAARREVALRHGLLAFGSIAEAINSTDIDFVDICTPPSLHIDGIRHAIAAGLPVICEKPVFVPGDLGYDDVLDHVWRGGTLVYPCQNYKYAPIISRVREILSSGTVGSIQHARVDIARRGHACGVAEWKPDWRRDPIYSTGGILRDHGTHAVYLILSLLGQQAEEVSVMNGTLAPGHAVMTTEDTAIMRLRCDKGAEVNVSLTWAAGHRSSRYLFAGTQGFVSIDNDVLTWSAEGRTCRDRVRSDFDDASHSAWFATMFADFARLAHQGASGLAESINLIAESLHTTAVIDAGYESARAGGAWKAVAALPPGGVCDEDIRTA